MDWRVGTEALPNKEATTGGGRPKKACEYHLDLHHVDGGHRGVARCHQAVELDPFGAHTFIVRSGRAHLHMGRDYSIAHDIVPFAAIVPAARSFGFRGIQPGLDGELVVKGAGDVYVKDSRSGTGILYPKFFIIRSLKL